MSGSVEPPLAPIEQEWLRIDTRWRDRMARRLRTVRAERDEAIRQRDELRAILAPLLDSPFCTYSLDEGEACGTCKFCGGPFIDANRDGDEFEYPHQEGASACPVLRAATLLGRERAPAPPAGPG